MHFLPRLAIVVAVVALGSQCSHAGIVSTEAVLLGPAENPPNASPGTGFATVEMDTIAHTLHVVVSFSNLLGTTTFAHIHARVAPPGNAAVATTTPTFVGFPIGVTSGSLDRVYDTTLASTFSAGFITSSGGTVAGAEAALFDALVAREAYLNIHTNVFPGGEIRGFLQPTSVPEPASLFIVGAGALAVVVGRRKQRTTSRAR